MVEFVKVTSEEEVNIDELTQQDQDKLFEEAKQNDIFVMASPNPKAEINFVGKETNWDDIIKAANAEVAANPVLFSTLKTVGAAGVASGNPITMAAGGAVYVGTDVVNVADKAIDAFFDESEFWTDYYNNIAEAMSSSNFATGYALAQTVTGSTLPDELDFKKASTAFTVGDVLGTIVRDLAIMSGGGKAIQAASGTISAQAAQNIAFVGGSSIFNAMNAASNEIGVTNDMTNAMRIFAATGLSNALTGTVFLGMLPKVTKKISGKLIDSQLGESIRTGLEFGGWGVADDMTKVSIQKALGDEKADFNVDWGSATALFALGAIGSSLMSSGKKTAEKIDDMVNAVPKEKVSINHNVTFPEINPNLSDIQKQNLNTIHSKVKNALRKKDGLEPLEKIDDSIATIYLTAQEKNILLEEMVGSLRQTDQVWDVFIRKLENTGVGGMISEDDIIDLYNNLRLRVAHEF